MNWTMFSTLSNFGTTTFWRFRLKPWHPCAVVIRSFVPKWTGRINKKVWSRTTAFYTDITSRPTSSAATPDMTSVLLFDCRFRKRNVTRTHNQKMHSVLNFASKGPWGWNSADGTSNESHVERLSWFQIGYEAIRSSPPPHSVTTTSASWQSCSNR